MRHTPPYPDRRGTEILAGSLAEGALLVDERGRIFTEGIVGDFIWNIERDEVQAHPTVFKLYGSPPIDGPVPGDWFRSRQHPDDAAETEARWRRQMAHGGQMAVEFRVIGDDGVLRWIDCRSVAVRNAAGKPYQVHGLNLDITARKNAELERRESEARARTAEAQLRTAMLFSNTLAWHWNFEIDRIDWSGPVKALYGVEPSALAIYADFEKIVLPADLPALRASVGNCISSGSEYRHEFRIVRPNGEVRWLAGRGGLLRDDDGRVFGITGVNFDITDKKSAEERLENEVSTRTLDLHRSLALVRQREAQLQNSLHEKDALLREIHHRVKNNLQIVSSFLSMRAATSPDARAALRDSERRISTMAMIHEGLYATEDMQTLEFAGHTAMLVENLVSSMAPSPLISCTLDLQPVRLAIHQAIPCALILNELLTNALKYAYPGGTGVIGVHLSCTDDMVTLTVSDNGAGLPASVDPYSPKTLGLEIVHALTRQLEGELSLKRSPGVSFSVRFRSREG